MPHQIFYNSATYWFTPNSLFFKQIKLKLKSSLLLLVQNLIAGIKSWKSMFRVWQSSFTRRDGNKAAHQMAKYAKHISDCIIWVEDTPPIIASQILHDVSVLGLSSV